MHVACLAGEVDEDEADLAQLDIAAGGEPVEGSVDHQEPRGIDEGASGAPELAVVTLPLHT